MTPKLVLIETKKSLTYTGVDGMVLIVVKDDNWLDVHQRIPSTSTSDNWQNLKARLADRLT